MTGLIWSSLKYANQVVLLMFELNFVVLTVKELDVFIVAHVKTDTEGHSKSFKIHKFAYKIEAAVSQIFYKTGIIKNFAKLRRKRASGLQFYWKRYSNTGVFL